MLGLYVKSPSDSNPMLPPSTSPPDVKTMALSSFVLSLSLIVTVVATAAVVAFVTVTPAITVLSAVPPIVIASASNVPSKSPSTASMLPMKVVAVTFLKLDTSLLESTVTTLLATTVPTEEPVSL